LAETWKSIVSASFYELNPFIVNPLVQNLLEWLRPKLPAALIALALIQLVMLALRRSAGNRALLGGIFAAITAVTVLIHWLAFRMFGLLLPKDRTAIFLVPLAVLLFGIVSTTPAQRQLRILSLVVL